MVAPMAAAEIIQSECLQAVGIHCLGVTLVYQPSPTTGEHDPTIFGKFSAKVASQQAVVATAQFCPANRYAQHGTPSVGIQKHIVVSQQFRAFKYSFYLNISGSRQQQKGCLSMLSPLG